MLTNELYSQMFVTAYRILRDQYDAMDVVQEAWIKILIKIDSLRERDKLLAWAKAIATNTALNLIKQRKLFIHVMDMEVVNQEQAAAVMGTEQVVWKNVIENCLNTLDPETKSIFIYKFDYGWPDKEIANKLGIPVGTVKARIHRGKKRLRNLLETTY